MKNVNITRIILALIIVLVTSIFIPEFYWKVFKHTQKRTNVSYSPIKKGFILVKSDVYGVNYTDLKGNEYTREQYEGLVPFLTFRQLMLSGKMPDSIGGIPVTPKEINRNNFTLRTNASAINSKPILLYPMFESKSGRVKLELPQDFFRITDRMEFIISSSNKIGEKKSNLFTEALKESGFQFPGKMIYGNPTTMKPFDEGYFVLDNNNAVFHIKMVKGQPVCKKTEIPTNLGIVRIVVNEYELREWYGMIITESNELYFISYDNYKLIKLPVDSYDHSLDQIQVKGDLLYRTIIINKENGYKAIVTDRNYAVVDSCEDNWPGKDEKTAGIISAYIFPFTIEIEKGTTPFVNFYINLSDFRGLIIPLILLIALGYYFRQKNTPLKKAGIFYLLVLLTGIFGFLAVLAIKDFEDDPS